MKFKSTVRKQRAKNTRTQPLSPFYSVPDLAHGAVPSTIKAGLPTSVDLTLIIPHRQAQSFVSMCFVRFLVFLNIDSVRFFRSVQAFVSVFQVSYFNNVKHPDDLLVIVRKQTTLSIYPAALHAHV